MPTQRIVIVGLRLVEDNRAVCAAEAILTGGGADPDRAPGAGLKMWLYPVLAHGLYDTVAMMASVTPQLSGAITIAILLFCFQMVKWARQGMKKHLIADASDYGMGGGVDIQG